MGAFSRIVATADRLGLRPWIARIASRAYSSASFEVDSEGHWVNRQAEATLVSPSIHAAPYSSIERVVLDYWTWGYLPRRGDTIIDVGAGIGEEAVVFSRLVGPTGRIISIEAHPDTFVCLQSTIERSNLDNVIALNCAVSDRDGELFISAGPGHLGTSHQMNTVLGGKQGVKVPARSLDSLAKELGLNRVAFLKMNIEGAEKLAMQGFDELAPRVSHAAISCHDFVATHFGGEPHYRTREFVRTALEAKGFVVRSRDDAIESWGRDYLYAAAGQLPVRHQ